ncbi:MAG: sialidase family protein [Hyphomicrobiaceae bacterium]
MTMLWRGLVRIIALALLFSNGSLFVVAETVERRPADRPQPRGSSDPAGAYTISGGYLFGPMIARGRENRIHMLFYRGVDHYWKGHATVGYARSEDDGASWRVLPDIVSHTDGSVHDRFAAFGQAASGRLIAMFVRRVGVNGSPVLHQVWSDDDGTTWHEPVPSQVTSSDSKVPKGDWHYPFGRIERTPAGKLAVMSYMVEDNFVLTSNDEGRTWTSRLVVSSGRPNYSEMGLELISENVWIAVSRIDNEINRMAQFVSEDAGRSWRLQGPLEIEASPWNVAPSIDAVVRNGRRVLLVSYCNRKSASCWLREADPAEAAKSPEAWRRPTLLDEGLVGLSGYQSILQSRDGHHLIAAITRERSVAESDVLVWRLPLPGTANTAGKSNVR